MFTDQHYLTTAALSAVCLKPLHFYTVCHFHLSFPTAAAHGFFSAIRTCPCVSVPRGQVYAPEPLTSITPSRAPADLNTSSISPRHVRGTCAHVQTCLSRDPHAIPECADPGAKLDRCQHWTNLQVAAPGQSVHMPSRLSSNTDHTRRRPRSPSTLCMAP